MKRLFVIKDPYQDLTAALAYAGPELTVLIVMANHTLATNLERELEARRRLAQRIEQARAARGQACHVLVEWGSEAEAIRNSLAREDAELLT